MPTVEVPRMILSPQAAIQAIQQHQGIISIIDADHLTVERISPANALLRCQLRQFEINSRGGKIKWMREIQIEKPRPKWLPGFRTEFGPVLSALPTGAGSDDMDWVPNWLKVKIK